MKSEFPSCLLLDMLETLTENVDYMVIGQRIVDGFAVPAEFHETILL